MTIHEAPAATSRVINALLRVAHGGSLHGGSLLNGHREDPYPTENKDPSRGRIKTRDVIIDHPMNMGRSRRLKKIEQAKRDAKTKDEWIWKDDGRCLSPKKHHSYHVV